MKRRTACTVLFYHFCLKSLRISRKYFISSLLNKSFLSFYIATVQTSTLLVAYRAFSETFTVHFETSWLLATTFHDGSRWLLLCDIILKLTKFDLFDHILIRFFIGSLMTTVWTHWLLIPTLSEMTTFSSRAVIEQGVRRVRIRKSRTFLILGSTRIVNLGNGFEFKLLVSRALLYFHVSLTQVHIFNSFNEFILLHHLVLVDCRLYLKRSLDNGIYLFNRFDCRFCLFAKL
jgi:hypothetical protein